MKPGAGAHRAQGVIVAAMTGTVAATIGATTGTVGGVARGKIGTVAVTMAAMAAGATTLATSDVMIGTSAAAAARLPV